MHALQIKLAAFATLHRSSKKLLRSVVDRLVLREDGIDIYCLSDQAEMLTIKGSSGAEYTGTKPVDLDSARIAKNQNRRAAVLPGVSGLIHYRRVSGSDRLKLVAGAGFEPTTFGL